MHRDPITSTRDAATARTVRRCVRTNAAATPNQIERRSASCVTSASAEERAYEPRYRQRLDMNLQDEAGVGEGGGRQGEVSRQPRGYIALPGCPRGLTFSSLPANSCTPLRMCNRGLTPASRFLAVLVFARSPVSGYKRVTGKARFFGLECESRVSYETFVLM